MICTCMYIHTHTHILSLSHIHMYMYAGVELGPQPSGTMIIQCHDPPICCEGARETDRECVWGGVIYVCVFFCSVTMNGGRTGLYVAVAVVWLWM